MREEKSMHWIAGTSFVALVLGAFTAYAAETRRFKIIGASVALLGLGFGIKDYRSDVSAIQTVKQHHSVPYPLDSRAEVKPQKDKFVVVTSNEGEIPGFYKAIVRRVGDDNYFAGLTLYELHAGQEVHVDDVQYIHNELGLPVKFLLVRPKQAVR